MKKTIGILILLGALFGGTQAFCFEDSVAGVIYKEFATLNTDEIVVVKLFIYSKPMAVRTMDDRKRLEKVRKIINEASNVDTSWKRSYTAPGSSYQLFNESIEYELDERRKGDVIWAYKYPCDNNKLFNKTKKRQRESLKEYFTRVLNETEECIKYGHKLKDIEGG